MHSKRTIFAALAALMIAAMLFSWFFLTMEAKHDCTGEDCHICLLIAQCMQQNKLWTISAFMQIVLIGFLPVLILSYVFIAFSPCNTLVLCKVKLSN